MRFPRTSSEGRNAPVDLGVEGRRVAWREIEDVHVLGSRERLRFEGDPPAAATVSMASIEPEAAIYRIAVGRVENRSINRVNYFTLRFERYLILNPEP